MRQIKESLEIIQYNKIGKEDYRPKIQKYVVNSINDAKKIFANSHELDKIDKVEVKDNGKVIYTMEIIPPSNTSKRYSVKWKKETKMNIKQLVEAANRKCEMRWKVLAFNPDKDNELVGEFKDFNCIDCAAQKKRELLAKNPNYTVEIISESKAQKNEGELKYFTYTQNGLKTKADCDKALSNMKKALAEEPNFDAKKVIQRDMEIVKSWKSQKNESWSDLYPVVAEIGTDWEFYKKKPKYTRNELKQATITKLKAKGKSFNNQDLEEALNRWYTSESAQKNEALYKIAKTNKEKEEILAKIEKDPSLKLVSIDNVVSGWKDNKNGIPIAQYNTRITYKKESSQKNEALDEHELKAWLKSEHSRALKNIKNMAANDSSSFFKGYATALHEIQRKFGL